MNNDSTHAGPSTFAPQPDDMLSLNLSGNQPRDTDTHGSQSSQTSAHGGGADSFKNANAVDNTHPALLDIPGLLDDPSPPATTASDIPSGDVKDL